jgi:uncharacterized protein (TIGR02147 family)
MSTPLPIYSFSSYKTYLRARIDEEENPWGLLTKLAAAAGCQRSYFSRMLSQETHLTPAQAFGLSRYWGLTNDETEYFLGLLEVERAGTSDYRDHLKRKNEELKRRQEDLAQLVKRNLAVSDERDLEYYSAWFWVAVHALTSIPQFQSESAISEKLGISRSQVRMILNVLEKWGAVYQDGARWKYNAREQHLSKESPLVCFHHSNWRQQAIMDAQRRNPASIHYTVVQSLSRADFERVKQLVLDLIEKSSRIAGPSKEEDLMCLTCDFFSV